MRILTAGLIISLSACLSLAGVASAAINTGVFGTNTNSKTGGDDPFRNVWTDPVIIEQPDENRTSTPGISLYTTPGSSDSLNGYFHCGYGINYLYIKKGAAEWGPARNIEHLCLDNPVEAEHARQAALSRLDDTYASQDLEQDWSFQVMDVIKGAFSGEEQTGTSLSGIDCRSSLCRLEVQGTDVDAINKLARWLPMNVAEHLPEMAIYHTETTASMVSAVIYLTRSGASLRL